MCKFRDLRADEIECRIGQIGKEDKGLSLLLYKDARCDMAILDETVGTLNWQREHYEVKGNMYCKVSIWDTEKNTWVWKSDCGTESNTEAQKGEASDSFKRACVNWGIGRELYTSPYIWITADLCEIKNHRCYNKFEVREMIVKNKVITGLLIVNTDLGNRIVYSYGECKTSQTARRPQKNASQEPQQQPSTNTPPQTLNAPQKPQEAPQRLPTAREYLLQLLRQRNIDVQQYMAANNLSKETPDAEVIRMIGELEQLPPAPNHVA